MCRCYLNIINICLYKAYSKSNGMICMSMLYLSGIVTLVELNREENDATILYYACWLYLHLNALLLKDTEGTRKVQVNIITTERSYRE